MIATNAIAPRAIAGARFGAPRLSIYPAPPAYSWYCDSAEQLAELNRATAVASATIFLRFFMEYSLIQFCYRLFKVINLLLNTFITQKHFLCKFFFAEFFF